MPRRSPRGSGRHGRFGTVFLKSMPSSRGVAAEAADAMTTVMMAMTIDPAPSPLFAATASNRYEYSAMAQSWRLRRGFNLARKAAARRLHRRVRATVGDSSQAAQLPPPPHPQAPNKPTTCNVLLRMCVKFAP